ncbi:hypothetical protein [Spirosoma pomorum]
MLIVFTTLQQCQHQTHRANVATLEEGLDWLNALVATGQQLCSAYLVDQHSNIRLPADAFDGQSMTGALQDLEQQWQALLPVKAQPTKRALVGTRWAQSRIDLTQQQLQRYERKIDLIDISIGRIEALLKRSHLGAVALSQHYQAVLTQLQLSKQRYQQQRVTYLTRLGQLLKQRESGDTKSTD